MWGQWVIHSTGLVSDRLRPVVRRYRRPIRSALSTAYSNAELGEKQLGFGGVLVFCRRASVRLLDKSVGNQAIENQAFICTQIFAPVSSSTRRQHPKGSPVLRW